MTKNVFPDKMQRSCIFFVSQYSVFLSLSTVCIQKLAGTRVAACKRKNKRPRPVWKHAKTLLLQRVECLQLFEMNARSAEMAKPPSDLCSAGFSIGVSWIGLAMT